MSVINLSKYRQSKRYRSAFLDFNIDATELVRYLTKTDTKLQKTVKSPEVLEEMADTVIWLTSESELIPYKDEYRVKSSRKKVFQTDEDGKVMRSRDKLFMRSRKRGAKKSRYRIKGKPKLLPFSPATHYSNKKEEWYEVETDPEYRVRKKGHDRLVTTYRVDEHTTKIKKGKHKGSTRTTKRFYTDRPPHLQDTGDTHDIIIKRDAAQIKIHAIKPRNSKFYDKGGVNYAAAQYFGEDINWNRTTENTTSRWLEVAFGLPVPAGTKIVKYPGAKSNMKQLIKILKPVVERAIKK